jgi:hypothetical protein
MESAGASPDWLNLSPLAVETRFGWRGDTAVCPDRRRIQTRELATGRAEEAHGEDWPTADWRAKRPFHASPRKSTINRM